jgi:hypothetical protein
MKWQLTVGFLAFAGAASLLAPACGDEDIKLEAGTPSSAGTTEGATTGSPGSTGSGEGGKGEGGKGEGGKGEGGKGEGGKGEGGMGGMGGGGGAGGGADCTTCGEALMAQMPVDNWCPGSDKKAMDLYTCVCNMCAMECATSICANPPNANVDFACFNCGSTKCQAELSACTGDTGK